MIIALDCEATGLDLHHDARPYFVTTCDENDEHRNWEWPVDYKTRMPIIPEGDKQAIRELLQRADRIVGQHLKFDVAALKSIGIEFPWEKAEDTIIAGHMLYSARGHSLDKMVGQYLEEDITPFEDKVQEATEECRRLTQRREFYEVYGHWNIAKRGKKGMPSAKEKCWKADMWLPLAIATECEYPPDHWYWTCLEEYAEADSYFTLKLWFAMVEHMKRRDLWEIYRARMEAIPVAWEMEQDSVTGSIERANELGDRFERERIVVVDRCEQIARDQGFPLDMPKSGNNDSLIHFVFKHLKLPIVKMGEKQPSLDKDVIEHYQLYLPDGPGKEFINELATKRRIDMALQYMESYERFWIPTGILNDRGEECWFNIYPSLNPTGTVQLRWSSSNPNEQNISKQEGYNLRYIFGPLSGREWWSLDAQNIELRIPAFVSGEPELVNVFLRPKDPPYFGSYHLVVFDMLYPKLFKEHGVACKDLFDSTYYQWVKNGNFCVPLDTEALTRDGWKNHIQLNMGDEVASYKDGKLIWTPVLNKIKFKDAPLIHMHNQHFSAVTTPHHRWLGSKRVCNKNGRHQREEFFTTEGMSTEHTIYLSAPMKDEKRLPISPVEAAIIGLVYTDGSIERSDYVGAPSQAKGKKVKFQAAIHQKKEEGVAYIEDVLSRWGGGFRKLVRPTGIISWILNPDAARSLWKRARLTNHSTKYDEDFEQFVLDLGSECRTKFLEAVHVAEGHLDSHGHKMYAQNVGAFADAIKLAVYLCGNYVTGHVQKNSYPTKHTCLSIRAAKPYVTGQRMEKEHVGTGDVWCIETAEGTWVMRQGDRIMLTGNSFIYGAQKRKADATYHVPGAYDLMRDKFPLLAKLSDKQFHLAKANGWVETLPDKTVNPHKGFPIQASRTDTGVLPTTPLNYFVSGSAMWWTQKGMVRCHRQLKEWRRKKVTDAHIKMQVHDEMVFDFPLSKDDPATDLKHEKQYGGHLPDLRDYRSNLGLVRLLQRRMEEGGLDIGVPTPVGVELNQKNWAEITLKC